MSAIVFFHKFRSIKDIGIIIMEISKTTSSTVILLTILVILCFYYFTSPEYKIKQNQQEFNAQMVLDNKKVMMAHAQSKTVQEYRTAFKECGFFEWGAFSVEESPASAWEASERSRLTENLSNQKFDILVLPPQEMDGVFDRTARMLSANSLAREIEISTGLKVVPPETSLRLLGPRSWRFRDKDIESLAKTLKVKVLHQYITTRELDRWCSRKNPRITVTMLLTNPSGNIEKGVKQDLGKVLKETYFERRFSEKRSLFVKALFDTRKENTRQKIVQSINMSVPTSFDEFVNPSITDIQQALYLQFLALLTPDILEFERNRLFERSILALSKVHNDSEYHDLAYARAYFHLGRRPQAMELLSDVKKPAESALKDYLNGNYNSGRKNLSKIESPLLFALSYIELNELGAENELKGVNIELPKYFSNSWSSLISYAATPKYGWKTHYNIPFFESIKGLYPTFDQILLSTIEKSSIDGPLSLHSSEIDTVLFDSFDKLMKSSAMGCCASAEATVRSSDITLLYRNISIANELSELYKKATLQSIPDSALRYSAEREIRLGGHPNFSLLYARSLLKSAESKTEVSRQRLIGKGINMLLPLQRHRKHADNIRSDLNGLISEFVETHSEISKLKPHPRENWFGYDFPTDRKERRSSRCKKNSWEFDNNNIQCIFSMLSQPKGPATILNILKGRFDGNPNRSTAMFEAYKRLGKSEEAEEVLIKEVNRKTKYWQPYEWLAQLYLGKGQYDKAYDVYSKYPYFTDAEDKNRVVLGNLAGQAGDAFYWRGQTDYAKKLYRIATSYSTGSGMEMSSKQRVAMMEQDFATAIRTAYDRGRRYNSPYGYRDYLAMLHLLGESDRAFKGFSAVYDRYKLPVVWTSALIGQRKNGFTKKAIDLWISDIKNKTNSQHTQHGALRHQLISTTLDRDLGDGYLKLRTSLQAGNSQENQSKLFAQHLLPTLRRLDYGPYNGFVGDLSKRHIQYLDQYMEFSRQAVLKSRDSRQGEVRKLLRDKFALPYILMSANVKDPAELEGIVAAVEKVYIGNHDTIRFDRGLSLSVIYAHLGDSDAASEHLKQAFYNRPHTMSRPQFSWYQITEVAEWVYHRTGDQRILDLAINWAKAYQVIQPQFAWSYAFEARYSQDRNARIRASAFTLYLDPKSQWLSDVPTNILEASKIWWKQHNPFVLKPVHQKRGAIRSS